MQFWKRIPIIIMATIILTVACQNHSTKTTFPTSFSTPQNGTGEDSPVSGLDLARFEEISRVLSMSEKGQSALQLVEAYQIRVRFEPGNGSRFIPNRNEIVIDSRAGKFSAALTMVHEVTHARYYHEGLTADILQSIFIRSRIINLGGTHSRSIGLPVGVMQHMSQIGHNNAALR